MIQRVMARKMSIRKQSRDYWPVLCAGVGVAIIVGWLLFGSTGVFAWSDYHRALLVRQNELAELKVEQSRLVNRQHLLNPRHVDPDLADEMVRDELNLIHPDDVVIPLK